MSYQATDLVSMQNLLLLGKTLVPVWLVLSRSMFFPIFLQYSDSDRKKIQSWPVKSWVLVCWW